MSTLLSPHSDKNGEIDQQREQYEKLKWKLERKLEELDGHLALQRQVGCVASGPCAGRLSRVSEGQGDDRRGLPGVCGVKAGWRGGPSVVCGEPADAWVSLHRGCAVLAPRSRQHPCLACARRKRSRRPRKRAGLCEPVFLPEAQ